MRAGPATARAVAIAALAGMGLGAVGATAVEVITTYRYDAAGHLILVTDAPGEGGPCGALAVTCAAGTTCCTGQCANLATSRDNCGTCGVVCSSNHVAPACAGGSCSAGTCAAGWADCDGDGKQRTGCEADILSSTATCGNCQGCSTSHVTPACVNGSCGAGTCAAGWGDCDGDKKGNGCESPLNTETHCGACRTPCMGTLPNGALSCATGACLPACSSGWGNCNGLPGDGCETSLRTGANCGACGRRCAAGYACAGGVCYRSCPTGTSDKCGDGRCYSPSMVCP